MPPKVAVVASRSSGRTAIVESSLRIVCAEPLAPKLRDAFRGRFTCPDSDSAAELRALAGDADVLLTRGRPLNAEIIEGKKLVHVLGRYPDRVDLEAARRTGALVATMPHGGAMAVADHTMALMLALARKIVRGHQGVVAGDYHALGKVPAVTSEWSFAFNWLGFPDVVEINRKTLGLIGFGEIGREVARRAVGFDMDVLYHQRRPLSPEWEAKLGARRASLDELFETSDIVSVHAPHTADTEKLVDAERIASMKKGAVFINTARGGLVDEAALVAALREGRLGGAGLDVFVEEPLPQGHPLTELDNVVLAPHTGGGSGGGHKRLLEQVLENVERFARGETPLNLVEV